MGSLDNRTDRWLGWVPLVKAARAYYIQEWVEFILSDTPRAQTCVHALALSPSRPALTRPSTPFTGAGSCGTAWDARLKAKQDGGERVAFDREMLRHDTAS